MNVLRTDLGRFRLISLLEGISYVVLLGIAMPLKYAAGHPEAVRIAGAVHGALFVAFCVALFAVANNRNWTRRQGATSTVAALLPLGAFWLEHRLRREPGAP